MRIVFLLLLLANLALLTYAWHVSRQVNPDAALITHQLNADKVRIMTPRPLVPLPAPKRTCLEFGPFGASDQKMVQGALDSFNLGDRLTLHDVQVVAGFWVYIAPLKNRSEVEHKVAELERLGVKDYYAVEGQGPMRNAISLGLFRTQEAAAGYLDGLREKGVRSARVGNHEHRITQTMFVVRDPDIALTSKLAELRLQFPGSDLKAADCK